MGDEHYSGEDPETGCGLMMMVLIVGVFIFWVGFIAAVFDWGPFGG